ncbi:MAG: hypothetical protein KI786_19150, partial [Mameliella sp.]|nr:hypothetical protein [Phaeodactylibacter sp.]
RNPHAGLLSWNLMNASGQQVRQGQVNVPDGEAQFQVPAEGLAAGTYNLQLVLGQSRTTLRMTIVE